MSRGPLTPSAADPWLCKPSDRAPDTHPVDEARIAGAIRADWAHRCAALAALHLTPSQHLRALEVELLKEMMK